MLIEIKGKFKKCTFIASEIETIELDERIDVDNGNWLEVIISLKSGNRSIISFHHDYELRDKEYEKVIESLQMFYRKDTIEDEIKKYLEKLGEK